MNAAETMKWSPYLRRYREGAPRATVFRDLILADAKRLEESAAREDRGLVFLDIGCGGGFDSFEEIQKSLAQLAGQYVGVEPDASVRLGGSFAAVHRCRFEDAPIQSESIDVAFAVMVLEHLAEPQCFWDKVHTVLRRGGVFWGFTVDARHWFATASLVAERVQIKNWYLNSLHGKRGEERYENYDVLYHSNTPRQIDRLTHAFSDRTVLNFQRVGQLDYYFSSRVKWLGRAIDTVAGRAGLPGTLLGVRVTK